MGLAGSIGPQLAARCGPILATPRAVLGRAQDRGAGGTRSAVLVRTFGCSATTASCSATARSCRRADLVAAGRVPALTDVPRAPGGGYACSRNDRLASRPVSSVPASAMGATPGPRGTRPRCCRHDDHPRRSRGCGRGP